MRIEFALQPNEMQFYAQQVIKRCMGESQSYGEMDFLGRFFGCSCCCELCNASAELLRSI